MKKLLSLLFMLVLLALLPLATTLAQGRANDIPTSELPKEVRATLEQYIDLLRTSKSLDEAERRLVPIAGGALVNEDGKTLRARVKPFSLKKDFEAVKFYANPTEITRVNATPSNGSGFGPSAIRGMVYKIWVAKADGQPGMPAPISIMVPDGHPSIRSPRVVNIGSL